MHEKQIHFLHAQQFQTVGQRRIEPVINVMIRRRADLAFGGYVQAIGVFTFQRLTNDTFSLASAVHGCDI